MNYLASNNNKELFTISLGVIQSIYPENKESKSQLSILIHSKCKIKKLEHKNRKSGETQLRVHIINYLSSISLQPCKLIKK